MNRLGQDSSKETSIPVTSVIVNSCREHTTYCFIVVASERSTLIVRGNVADLFIVASHYSLLLQLLKRLVLIASAVRR